MTSQGPNRGYGKSESVRRRTGDGESYGEKDDQKGSMEEFNENRSGGRRDGGTPDYEESQSPNYEPREYPSRRDLG